MPTINHSRVRRSNAQQEKHDENDPCHRKADLLPQYGQSAATNCFKLCWYSKRCGRIMNVQLVRHASETASCVDGSMRLQAEWIIRRSHQASHPSLGIRAHVQSRCREVG